MQAYAKQEMDRLNEKLRNWSLATAAIVASGLALSHLSHDHPRAAEAQPRQHHVVHHAGRVAVEAVQLSSQIATPGR